MGAAHEALCGLRGAPVARPCKVATHKHVAAEYRIDRKTVKNIDKRHLEATLGPPDLSRVCRLAMDEFAIQKGYRYAMVIIETRRKEVLWVGAYEEGRMLSSKLCGDSLAK